MATFTTNTEPELENHGVLASWKGIAAYFGCNVRTASQRAAQGAQVAAPEKRDQKTHRKIKGERPCPDTFKDIL